MIQKTPVNVGGILSGLTGVAFLVLKITGVIDWPWVWVLAPFWIPFVMVLFSVMVFILIILLLKDKE
jgi:hypothetical protein